MRNYLLLILLSIFHLSISAQTFRNGFDYYEFNSGGEGQGFSFHSNIGGVLNYGERIYLETYIDMFKATKDKKYLDKLLFMRSVFRKEEMR